MKIKTIIIVALLCASCADSFLDVKKESSMTVPGKVEDFIGLMDNKIMYTGMATELSTYGADEFTVPDGQLFSLTVPLQRNAYIWLEDVYEGQAVSDWDLSYQRILYCNMVLEGLDKLNSQRGTENWRNAKGMAYFFRAFNFFFLQQEFGQIYNGKTADISLGIPLRLESDVTLASKRSSVADTYKQIIADLHSALPLLPERPLIRQRPSKQAVFALLTRVYLVLEDYGKALDNAQQCIDLGGRLMDYKDIDPSKTAPFPSDVEMNSEMILYTTMQASTLLRTRYSINPDLLALFSENDLRRQLYFQYNADGKVLFRGSYMGVTGTNFTGLALDEINLIKIECLLRLDRSDEAETLLKLYLSTRLRDNEMIGYPKEKEDLLPYVFMERQRQLVFRGVRWMDLRRLNSDSRFSKTLRKQIDGQVYELEPGSKRYIWPIPEDAVAYGGLEQNKR